MLRRFQLSHMTSAEPVLLTISATVRRCYRLPLLPTTAATVLLLTATDHMHIAYVIVIWFEFLNVVKAV